MEEPGLALRGTEPGALIESLLLLRATRSGDRNATETVASLPPSTTESSTISARMVETLPKLYDFEAGSDRVFLPLTVTDEVGRRWTAYSLIVPTREPSENEDDEALLILVALSGLKRCFAGMCALLETVLETSLASEAEGAQLISWIASLAPHPLPGLAYEIVVDSLACRGRKIALCNAAPSNLLPWATEVHFYKLVQVLGVHGVFKVWVSALLEQRILLVTRKRGPLASSYLTICAETILMLLEPMKWQGIYVPFVPNAMSVLVEAPTPYIMGICESGLRGAELDDGIVEVNIDNGRVCLPSNLPITPESLETRLDAIDASLSDPLQRGFGAEGEAGLLYEPEDVRCLVCQVRQTFGGILVDIVERTKKLSQNGTRSLEDIRGIRSRSASKFASSFPRDGTTDDWDHHSPRGTDSVELVKGKSFTQTPDRNATASTKKKNLFSHRRSISWDLSRFQNHASTTSTEHTLSQAQVHQDQLPKFDFIPDTESYEESLYFYEEFYQTQIFQEFLASGWPPNWPECAQWDTAEMERRHSANKALVRFHLRVAGEGGGDGRQGSGEGAEGDNALAAMSAVLERARVGGRILASSTRASAIVTGGGSDASEISLGDSPSLDAVSEWETGETIAMFAAYVDRCAKARPENDCATSPLPQTDHIGNGIGGVSNASASTFALRKLSGLHPRYECLDYYEKALEIGVQTYSCIPMARIYTNLSALEEAERDKIEASLGPNLCLLLERVRATDGDAATASREEEEEEGGAQTGKGKDFCATLASTANRDLSLLRVTTGGRPLNMVHPRRRGTSDVSGSPADAEKRQPEEIMLVCISTVKMLLTIQANKNTNKVRQYIDANDVIEVAESAEYMYFSEATSELAAVDPSTLSQKQRVVFFINLYNLMILHAALERARNRKEGDSKLRWLPRASPFGWLRFLRNATYNVGGNVYSALEVEHSILRSSRPNDDNVLIGRLLPFFKRDDPRMKCKVNQQVPLLTFALCPGTMCSPPFKCFHEYDFDNELLSSAQTYLARYCHTRRRAKVLEVRLPLLLKWYRHDLGHSGASSGKRETPNKWLISIAYLIKGTKVSQCILQAIDDGVPIAVKYDTYKWELGWMLQES